MINVVAADNIPSERVDEAFKRYDRGGQEARGFVDSDRKIERGERFLVLTDGTNEDIKYFIEKATKAGADIIVEFTPSREGA